MAETRRTFDRDFKDGAVRLVRETRQADHAGARDLGINAGTLGYLVNADKSNRGSDGVLSEDGRGGTGRAAQGGR
jgi:transposase